MQEDVIPDPKPDNANSNDKKVTSEPSLLEDEEEKHLKEKQAQKDTDAFEHKIKGAFVIILLFGWGVIVRIFGWIFRKAEKAGLHDWLMVVFTLVLTIVAIEQFIVAKQNSDSSTTQMRQVIDSANRMEDAADSFSKSSADMSRGVNDAVAKLKAQAAATQSAADTSRAALVDVQRAFITYRNIISQIQVEKQPTGNVQRVAFRLVFENSGTTPAINYTHSFTTRFDSRYYPSAEDAEPNESDFIGPKPYKSNIVVGAKDPDESGELYIPSAAMFGKELDPTTHESESGKPISGIPLLWGWAIYRDIFKGTKPHLTEFCARIGTVDISEEKPLEPRLHYVPCKKHNCADEYCKDYKTIVDAAYK